MNHRTFHYVLTAQILMLAACISGPAHADAKLLPPMENDGTDANVCKSGAGNKVLTWDGERSLKCVKGVTIDDYGHVGIGTSSPGAAFHVNNNANETDSTEILLSRTGGDGHNYGIYSAGATSGVGPGKFSISDETVGRTPRFIIDSDGNIGIGNSFPATRLDVRGGGSYFDDYYVPERSIGGVGIGGDMQDFWFNSTDNNAFWFTFRNNDPNGYFTFRGMSGGTNIATFANNGNVSVTGTITGSVVSDERLKQNITPLAKGEGIESLSKLHPVTFEWKNPSLHKLGTTTGFVAQEVQKEFPDWVHETNAMGDDEKLLPKKTRALAVDQFPAGFDALVVRAIQDLAAENKELKTANDTQAMEIKELKARLDALEAREKK